MSATAISMPGMMPMLPAMEHDQAALLWLCESFRPGLLWPCITRRVSIGSCVIIGGNRLCFVLSKFLVMQHVC